MILLHSFSEFSAQRFFGPPNTWYVNGFAKFLHHFFAPIVGNNDNFDSCSMAALNPFLEFICGFFFGMKA